MTDVDKSDDAEVGYKKPPLSTRFRKGQSGNPKGRPRGRHKEPPYDAVLGQKVTIREDGEERKLTAAQAFLLYLTKRGLEGDGAASRAAMAAIEHARATRIWGDGEDDILIISTVFVRPGSVTSALEPLRMARKLDRHRDTARVVLEPWIVEAALARLGGRRLTLEQQKTVINATRTPRKVRWPDWWKVKP